MNTFWYKAIALVLVLFGLQIAAGLSWFQFDRITILNSQLDEHKNILFLGDSIPDKIAPQDTDRRTIPQMVEQSTGKSIGDFSFPAYGTSVFESIIDYIARQKNKPEAIILPINLSTFSALVDRRPEYQFEKEKFYFTTHPSWLETFYRPLAISHLLNVNTVTQEEAMRAPIFYGTKPFSTIGNFDITSTSSTTPPETRDRYIYIARYMYTMKTTDRKFISLEHTLNTAARAGIKVYLYITPMDYAAGERLVGPDFKKQVSENINLICSLAEAKNIPCLNLVFAVPHDGFIPHGTANEHLNEAGRKLVADEIASFFHLN